MADYLVLDCSEAKRRIALLDRLGCYHVAKCHDTLPVQGASLEGTWASPGASVLSDTASGGAHRITFESVNCGRQATYDLL